MQRRDDNLRNGVCESMARDGIWNPLEAILFHRRKDTSFTVTREHRCFEVQYWKD